MEHKYFDIRQSAWLPIPGRVYLVSLPINLTFPKLRGHTLIAHKCPAGKGWVVAHQSTSATISRGKTRAAAVDAAYDTLAAVGEDKFLAAVAAAQANIEKSIAANGPKLFRAPTGNYYLDARTAPAPLAYCREDGSTPSDEDIKKAWHVGPRIAGLRTKTWPTAEAALVECAAHGIAARV